MKTVGSDSGLNLTHDRFRRLEVPVAPLNEQRRIVETYEELVSDLDAGVAALEWARAKLKLYRAWVLKAAVEGALTAEWRAKHPHAEPAPELLKRILVERRRRWEEDQLAKFNAKGQEPPKNWKAKYKAPAAWTDKLRVYDLRTNLHFTLKQSPIQRKDFDEFVACYRPGKPHQRQETWSEKNPDGRWRCFDYADLLKRDKLSLDLFWIKDKSLTDTDALPAPDVLATEIVDDLETALEQFTKIAARLRRDE